MAVQARFFVQSFTRSAASDHTQLTLVASSRGAENKSWAKWTPTGKLEMSVTNGPAADWFIEQLGKDIALTFEPRPIVCPACKEETRPAGEHVDTLTCPHCEHVFKYEG